MAPRQTALGRLLQERREAAGYSRTRIAELARIRPGTIEGWELGRVGKPPVHDVLRLSHVLRIPPEDVQRAVFEDAGELPVSDEGRSRKRRENVRRSPSGAVPLLEAAFRLFGWASEEEAARALGTESDRVRAWRSGSEQMAFADYLTLTSMIGVAAAEAMKGDEARIADLAAAARELGIDPGALRAR
ncbi:MAG: helix-turn-helix domain-containing protein [Thermoleophilia bacterium]|nr:helix-turn-helix domain-containing protein [Thermoleophilia bacterium]